MNVRNPEMPGNPHYDILTEEKMLPEHGIVHANLAVAFELRTLTLALAQNTPGWLDEVRARLGHPTAPNYKPIVDDRCNKPLMDGRNEIRCWGPKDHAGECT